MTIAIQSADQLIEKKCVACEGGVPKYERAQAVEQLTRLGDSWQLSEDATCISRKWKLKNFVEALNLANAVGQLAEQEQHHPDIHLTGYRLLRIDLTTHAIGGLSENDFILAAKINQLSA